MVDIFEIATRSKYRYVTRSGELTTEELWDLPLNELGKLYELLKNELDKPENTELLYSTYDLECKLAIVERIFKVKMQLMPIPNHLRKVSGLNVLLMNLFLNKRKNKHASEGLKDTLLIFLSKSTCKVCLINFNALAEAFASNSLLFRQ